MSVLLFQLAAVELMEKVDFIPDILHVNDYHTAMIPFLVKGKISLDWKPIKNIRTVLTIFTTCSSKAFLTLLLSAISLAWYGTLRRWHSTLGQRSELAENRYSLR